MAKNFLFSALVLLFTVACSTTDESDIVGTWKVANENVEPECGFSYFAFEADGILKVSAVGATTDNGELKCLKTVSSGNYRFAQGKIVAEDMVVTGDNGGWTNELIEYRYRFDKGDLHLTAMDNSKVHLVKITKY